MSNENKTLKELLAEIDLLIEYAAPEERKQEARQFARHYANDRLALALLHHFYSFLPQAEEDAVVKIALIDGRQGIFLMLATTLQAEYLYLVNAEEARLVGNVKEGLADGEIRTFFGWRDEEAFQRAAAGFSSLPAYDAAAFNENRCPVCAVTAGEYHIMGCPVEICPWCGGQLTDCNCRFTQLGREQLDSDSHIDELYEKAARKGRIPFDPQKHAPSYFSLGKHLQGGK